MQGMRAKMQKQQSNKESIFAPPNKYGYKINIAHPLIYPHYERFKRIKNAIILSDEERFEFEDKMIAYIKQKQEEKQNGKDKG